MAETDADFITRTDQIPLNRLCFEDAIRYRALARRGAAVKTKPAFTEGHCEHKKAPGGCQLHNLHCGYPDCDRRPSGEPRDE